MQKLFVEHKIKELATMKNFFVKHEIKGTGTFYEPKIWNEKIALSSRLYGNNLCGAKLLNAIDNINEDQLLKRLKEYMIKIKKTVDTVSAVRIRKNLDVLDALTDSSSKTEISKELLGQYSGWAGLTRQVLSGCAYDELNDYLDCEQIDVISKIVHSYCTPELLVQFMWEVLVRMGINDKQKAADCYNILNPAAGIGELFNYMPLSIRQNSYIEAIELDHINCEVFSKLHSDIRVINTKFKNFYYPDNFKYDLIIGNSPCDSPYYSGIIYNSPFNNNLSHLKIYHWFAAKSASILRDKGIIAMILPQFFLDDVQNHARDIIHKSGVNLICAYRLPDNLFAGAKVTFDIVFLQKTEKQVDWQATRQKQIGKHSYHMNEYFFNNPHHILGDIQINTLGKLESGIMNDKSGITCKSNGDLKMQLQEAYLKIKKILH